MIDWLLNDILWGWGQRGVCFYCGFLGDRARLLKCLYHAYLEVTGHPLKNSGLTDCRVQQFSRGFRTLYGSKGKTRFKWTGDLMV